MTTTLGRIGQPLYWLGGNVDVRVEVDTGEDGSAAGLWGVSEWGVASWGSRDPAWNDVSRFVLDVVIDGGAQRWGERWRAATATITVDNTTGIFTPDAEVDDPFHLPFRPGRRIRVVAVPDPTDPDTKRALFTGSIDATFDIFGDAGADLETTIPCVDFAALWALYDPPALATPTGVQDTDDRVAAALDRFGWADDAASRDLQTGVHTMQSSFLAQSTLEECARAADAEGGAFFASPDGKATFKARDWLTTDSRSTNVQGYLGYDEVPTGEQGAHLVEVETSYERSRVRNVVQFARIGGALQEVEDATSIATLDARQGYRRTDYHNNADSEVLHLAERYLEVNKDHRMRLDSATIAAVEDPNNDDLNRLLWDTRYGDLLQAKVETDHGWSFERTVQVFGIHHHITSEDWETTFRLDDAMTEILASS